MEKVEPNHSGFEQLPTSVVGDILSRLPTKACLNCKLVCKEWYDIIVDPKFANMRRTRGCYTTILLHCKLSTGSSYLMLLDLDKSMKVDDMESDDPSNKRSKLRVSSDTMIKFKSRFPSINDSSLTLANECNGITCLKSEIGWGPIVICNLLTGQSMSTFVEHPCKKGHRFEVYGLGCCPVTDEYKVLGVLTHWLSGKRVYEAQVQTLGTNEWRSVGTAKGHSVVQGDTIRTFFKGALHWYSYDEKCIISFHFGNEKFSRIELPDTIGEHTPLSRFTCCVFNSCLCFSTMMPCHKVCKVWVMKEYGVKKSWTMEYAFRPLRFDLPRPILENDSKEMLLCFDEYRLVMGNTITWSCKGVRVPEVSVWKVLTTYEANFTKSEMFEAEEVN